jgi:hypothetical protein
MAAIIVQDFDQLVHSKDVSITSVMDLFPKILKSIYVVNIGKTSLWIARKVPPASITRQLQREKLEVPQSGFFETQRTGPCTTRTRHQPT